MAKDEVVIKIMAKTAEARQTIKDALEDMAKEFGVLKETSKKTSDEMSNNINNSVDKMEKSTSRLSKAWSALKGAWLGITGAVAAVHFLKKWALDSIEAETAFNKLKTQIELTGVAFRDVEPSVTAAIKATSQYAIVQEEDVAKTLQELIFITGDLGKSQENLNLVYDLAYQKGISVSESASLIGKAMTGNIEMLGRYFLEFRNLNETLGENYTNSQAAAYAMTVLQEKVAGASEKMTEHARLVKEVGAAWKDFTQWVGDLFLKTVDLGAKGFEYLFKSWDARKLAKAKTDLDALSKALDNVGDTSKQTAREQAAAFKKANELTKEQTRVEKAEVAKRKGLEKELLDVRIKNYHDAVTELKATLADGERRYRDYRDEVLRLEGEISKERGKSETFLRDMRRRFMSESQRNISILKDAEGNLSQAKKAFARGDYVVAAEFFRKAQTDYETLEGKMKSKTQTFAGTTQKIYATVEKGYTEASDGIQAAFAEQQKIAITNALEQKKANGELETQIGNITTKIKTLTKEKKAIELEITVEGYDEAITKKAELEKPTSSVHTIYVQEVQTQSTGGVVKAATGRYFPGYGGGDKIPILGEAGEYMNRKESVRFWGVGLFDALNRMDMASVMASLGANKFAEGGAIPAPGRGEVSSPVRVDLNLGNKTFTMTAANDVANEFVKQIKRTNILYGRHTTPY